MTQPECMYALGPVSRLLCKHTAFAAVGGSFAVFGVGYGLSAWANQSEGEQE